MQTKDKTTDQDYHSSIEAARRSQIIRYAIETIATLGYAQASLAQIAKRAGMSKSVISYHFTSKDELIEQVVTDTYTSALLFILPRIPTQSTASDQLRAYIQADVDFIGTHRMQVTALVEIMTNFRTGDGKLRYDVQAEEPILAGLESFLRKGQQDGDFRTFDTRVMAVTMRRAIDALPHLLTASPDLDLDAYARELVELFDRATRKG
jgi:TetR/AcrR family fatty acid metabolism transcriptional regulator